MLDFATHLRKVRSQMVVEKAEPAATPPPDYQAALQYIKLDLQQLRDAIPHEVSRLISDLQNRLLTVEPASKQGWWDSIKNWWSNIWRGKYNQSNPYYYQNRLGELGRKSESINHGEYTLSLTEYRLLKQAHDRLIEDTAGTQPMIRLQLILRKWGADLQNVLLRHIDNAEARIDHLLTNPPRVMAATAPKLTDADDARVGDDEVPEDGTPVPGRKRSPEADERHDGTGEIPEGEAGGLGGGKPPGAKEDEGDAEAGDGDTSAAAGTTTTAPPGKPKPLPGTGGKVYGIGDIHGEFKEMMLNLKHQGLVDDAGNWAGGKAILGFTGDLVDRGPQGYEVVRKVMQLQNQAKAAGGEVIVTMGNHDIMAFGLARLLREHPEFLNALAKRKDEMAKTMPALQILRDVLEEYTTSRIALFPDTLDKLKWIVGLCEHQIVENGMTGRELVELALDQEAVNWGISLPAMVRRRGILFQHVNSGGTYNKLINTDGSISHNGESWEFKDTDPYDEAKHTDPISRANESLKKIMAWGDPRHVEAIFNLFTSKEHTRTWNKSHTGETPEKVNKEIDDHLGRYGKGVNMVAHGHTPHNEDTPYKYGNDRVVNLDTGFAYSPHRYGNTGRMYDFSPHAISDDEDSAAPAKDAEAKPVADPAGTPGAIPTDPTAGSEPIADDDDDGTEPPESSLSSPVPPKGPGGGRSKTPAPATASDPSARMEFPATDMPKSEKGESDADYNRRLYQWVNDIWDYYASRNKLDRHGRINSDLGKLDREDFYDSIRRRKKPDFLGDKDEDSPPPDAGSSPPPPGPSGPPPGPAPLDPDLQKKRELLEKYRGMTKGNKPSEVSALEKEIWLPWERLNKKKAHYNQRAGGYRSHNNSVVGKPLPYVLRRNVTDAEGRIVPDPRIEIIRQYYPDAYRQLMDAGRIETETDTEESVQERIKKFRAFKAKKKKADEPEPTPEPEAEPANEEIVQAIESLRGKVPDDVLDELRKHPDVETIKELLARMGEDPGEDFGPSVRGLGETVIDRYRRLLREGKRILRSEYESLPVSARHLYFKQMLASG